MIARRSSATNCSPAERSPMTTELNPAREPEGASSACDSWITRSRIDWHAIAQIGVFSEGFQTTGSPQTRARAAFQAQTATGKLKAVMTPTGPTGCHCSISRCPGRSLVMVSP